MQNIYDSNKIFSKDKYMYTHSPLTILLKTYQSKNSWRQYYNTCSHSNIIIAPLGAVTFVFSRL